MALTKKFCLYKISASCLLLSGFLTFTVIQSTNATQLKPRLIVLTDIGPSDVEPDDHESMVRLLASADLFEIEALIAGEGWNSGNYPPGWMDTITSTINAYEKDAVNLMKRSNQTGFTADESKQEIAYWPSPAYLRSRTMLGSAQMGYSMLGANNNSAGSDRIIKLADENDDRPLHVAVWGGANTLAQAIWRIQKERTSDQLKVFLHKFTVYTITDQDMPWNTTGWSTSSHYWMRQQFQNDLLFIWDECAWLYQNSTGVSRWTDYANNIQGHGALGAQYPKYKWGVEGDTPSFMYLMYTGLSNPLIPTQGNWGGYFEFGKTKDGTTSAYTNHQGAANDTCNKYVNYFYQADFNNFAARMDWASTGKGNRNPVVVVNDDSSFAILALRPMQGTPVTLDASATFDPDGNTLSFKWWIMPKAGTFAQAIPLADAATSHLIVSVPANSAGKTFHVICEVTDNGTPALTGYRRIIFEPTDKPVIVKAPVPKTAHRTLPDVNLTGFDCAGRRIAATGKHAATGSVVLTKGGRPRIGSLSVR